MLNGKKIFLRTLNPGDTDVLFKWENDRSIWKLSNTLVPFTRQEIINFISEPQDIYTTKQLRFMICLFPKGKNKSETIGCIDLFDFDAHHLRAGIGVLIADKKHRKKGYASEALSLVTQHCFDRMNLLQLYCNITQDNKASLKLFQKLKFKTTGKKKNWVRDGKKFLDEYMLQLLNS